MTEFEPFISSICGSARHRLRRPVAFDLTSQMDDAPSLGSIVGRSAAFQQVLRAIETVGSTDSTVLLLGETGTGKELVARAIHEGSRRGQRAMVKVNCAAIPTGLLESEVFRP